MDKSNFDLEELELLRDLVLQEIETSCKKTKKYVDGLIKIRTKIMRQKIEHENNKQQDPFEAEVKHRFHGKH
jgi:hypothetical protein